jgi:hypothetical protein
VSEIRFIFNGILCLEVGEGPKKKGGGELTTAPGFLINVARGGLLINVNRRSNQVVVCKHHTADEIAHTRSLFERGLGYGDHKHLSVFSPFLFVFPWALNVEFSDLSGVCFFLTRKSLRIRLVATVAFVGYFRMWCYVTH